jgi:DNA polymerase-3 subunit beta
MNVTISAGEILKPLQSVIGAVENKQTIPIISHVLVEIKNKEIKITATDMEVELSSSCKIKSNENIVFTAYAKNLVDIVKKIPIDTNIDLVIEENSIHIKSGKNLFKLNTFNYKEFPLFKKNKNIDVIKIESDKLKEIIEKTSFSMGIQDIRSYLNGLYIEAENDDIVMVSTDGHRLSIGKTKQKNNLKNKKSMILPKKAVVELSKIISDDSKKKEEVDIHIGENYFYLTNNTTTINSRLIDGNFPDYNKVMPVDYENNIVINRKDFLNSLDQASVFVEGNTKGAKFIFKNSTLDIFSKSEKGQSKVQTKTEKFNEKIEVTFNISYIIAILEKLFTDEINIVLSKEENQPCLLSNVGYEDYKYVVMPMRV